MKTETNPEVVVANGAKLIGESVLPGASLMMDGKLLNGAAHAIVGFGARALLGPAGIALVAADSFSKSLTDKYVWEHATDLYNGERERFAARASKKQAAGEVTEISTDVDAAPATPKKATRAKKDVS